MRLAKTALLLPLLLFAAGTLWGQARYGEAIVEQGEMMIVRDGRSLRFDQPGEAVAVVEDDLIRVRPASRVVLRPEERAELTLGANAVFHVKPWQSKGKTGFLRALFGRFRAAVTGLVGGEQFNVKTATATIGVKGTGYNSSVTTRGATLLFVTEDTVGYQGQRGAEVDVNEGFVTLTINISPPTPPAPAPPQVQQQLGPGNLDAPPANSPGGQDFPGEEGLIQAGILTEDELEEGKGDEAEGRGADVFETELFADPGLGSESQRRARVPLQFGTQ